MFNHSSHDWISIYLLHDTNSREIYVVENAQHMKTSFAFKFINALEFHACAISYALLFGTEFFVFISVGPTIFPNLIPRSLGNAVPKSRSLFIESSAIPFLCEQKRWRKSCKASLCARKNVINYGKTENVPYVSSNPLLCKAAVTAVVRTVRRYNN